VQCGCEAVSVFFIGTSSSEIRSCMLRMQFSWQHVNYRKEGRCYCRTCSVLPDPICKGGSEATPTLFPHGWHFGANESLSTCVKERVVSRFTHHCNSSFLQLLQLMCRSWSVYHRNRADSCFHRNSSEWTYLPFIIHSCTNIQQPHYNTYT
jgi:hypothetical protein